MDLQEVQGSSTTSSNTKLEGEKVQRFCTTGLRMREPRRALSGARGGGNPPTKKAYKGKDLRTTSQEANCGGARAPPRQADPMCDAVQLPAYTTRQGERSTSAYSHNNQPLDEMGERSPSLSERGARIWSWLEIPVLALGVGPCVWAGRGGKEGPVGGPVR